MKYLLLTLFVASLAIAELPTIYNPSPVTVPSATFPDNYLVGLNVSGSPTSMTAVATFRPYSASTSTIYSHWDKDTRLSINLWATAARSTLTAQVMGGIVQLSSLLLQEDTLKKQLAKTPNDTGLQAQLTSVETALGVTQ